MFQFTHPGRGATKPNDKRHELYHVSIHAPREGCDTHAPPWLLGGYGVSIHAPREGCDASSRKGLNL